MNRWWYTPPWRCSDLWRPAFLWLPHGGDEFCNPTVLMQVPFLGAVVARYRRGPLRTAACEECQAENGPWCDGCLGCHDGPRCHPWADTCPSHALAFLGTCPECGGDRCFACEPYRWRCSRMPPDPGTGPTIVNPAPRTPFDQHTDDALDVVDTDRNLEGNRDV